ncbi:phosphonate ABC transporter substrate-binding protein [Martelella alba]|uniref:Phosphonate ABC transporter substrate-binding protein n=1 Tax=Martelella alba TaxID=2590451 RepID=A0A506U3B6_9HYPH|nr:substrate-binding domain-containing protein [Martelella alba]TPW27505.1 phosphonate ABC transporter substrate-binding protein [Martelella alba]
MRGLIYAFASLVLACVIASGAAARDQIQIVGSSTVLPYARIVAETFGEVYAQFRTPVVESGGSAAGIKEFCRGVGMDTVDIADASRPITPMEIDACAKNGVSAIEEVKFGYDGIVFANDVSAPHLDLTPADLYRALAARVVVDGSLVDNPYKRWSEVNPDLPDLPITVFIPGEKHGTREVFEVKLLAVGCVDAGAYDAFVDEGGAESAHAACLDLRKDGRAVDIDGDYTETLARISANRSALGVFGLSFYENNVDKLNVATISGVTPSSETVASGAYPVSRPLYFYVKKAHLDVVPGLAEYVAFFLSDDMIGPYGLLADRGLVAAPEAERMAMRQRVERGETL